ncbi:hypothetical protein P171DRAFT_487143 [Karstenula rhodostoma CBS 690.94]|uniref:Uncharacterized protein n=1 Tax=Karstenula rhodostoma CBS 690.94 TaxID=1392251 RepID=A0A9P4PHC9_9PLEO|nr:hypothetical protein P171DRAFT_487143 [Karstenula rhodostoma CBS 690.94]
MGGSVRWRAHTAVWACNLAWAERSDAAGDSPVVFIILCAAHRQSRLAAASYIAASKVAPSWSEGDTGTDGPDGASCDGTPKASVHPAAAREASSFMLQRRVGEREQTLQRHKEEGARRAKVKRPTAQV